MAEESSAFADLVDIQFHQREFTEPRSSAKRSRLDHDYKSTQASEFKLSDYNKISSGPRFQRNREFGLTSISPRSGAFIGNVIGQKDCDASNFYHKFGAKGSWNPEKTVDHTGHGGVFGMDFTSDGSVLAVACENRSLLFFDPLNEKLTGCVQNAHEHCANTVRFLDDRLFASCSDDHSVKLWDLRNTKNSIRTMRGHHNWVKNVEFIRSKGLLLSSAFDGYVYAWDVNNSQTDQPKRLFYTPGLMRMRVTPDETKMILSTQWGYMLVVHDLNLENMARDLFGFKPNMYWLMIKSGEAFSSSAINMCRFSAKENRTELIMDVPENCDPENISAICPHPESWCIASRTNNHDERSEWTCIHDLQNPPVDTFRQSAVSANEYSSAALHPSTSRSRPTAVLLAEESPREEITRRPSSSSQTTATIFDTSASAVSTRILVEPREGQSSSLRARVGQDPESIITVNFQGEDERPRLTDEESSEEESEDEGEEIRRTEITAGPLRRRFLRRRRNSEGDQHGRGGGDVLEQNADARVLVGGEEGDSRVRQRRNVARARRRGIRLNLTSQEGSTDISVSSNLREPRAFFIRTGPPNSGSRTIVVLGGTSSPPLIQEPPDAEERGQKASELPKTYSRLLFYQEEPLVGRGFIKEQSWSPDGRILASPYAYGVRLLAFNKLCQELDKVMPAKREVAAREMREIATCVTDQSVVLCAKFSPVHCLLATGSYKGKVSFLQPKL